MSIRAERRLLATAVALGGIVPVAAGLAGVLGGVAMTGGTFQAGAIALDSHVRYLSGLLLGIGLAFWATVPRIATSGPRFRLLTAIVFTGGLGRLVGVVMHGPPPPPMLFGLLMELIVTPLLCAWQWRIASVSRGPASSGGGSRSGASRPKS